MKHMLGELHGRLVMSRRVRVLSACLKDRIPYGASVLDVGSGDGAIARAITETRPDITIQGVDVLIRPETAIRITQYDGVHLPFADNSFDVITLVDVLHHTTDPGAVLREVSRVARALVLIKDHQTDRWGSVPTLRFMDWVGNAPHGVALPYNYLSKKQWLELFSESELYVTDWRDAPGLYPWTVSWLFGGSLHALITLACRRAAVTPNSPSQGPESC